MISNFFASVVSVLYIQRLVFRGTEIDIKHTSNSVITRVRKVSTMFVKFGSYADFYSFSIQTSVRLLKEVNR